MPAKKKSDPAFEAAQQKIAKPEKLDAMLAKMAAKDRANIEKHLAQAEANGAADRAELWRKLARALFTLAGHAVTTSGQQSVLFFVQDGKYRLQAFAIEDPRDGTLVAYANDVIAEAVKIGLLAAPKPSEAALGYLIEGHAGQRLVITTVDNANTPNPQAWYKSMLGWNRKAMRISLPGAATGAQVETAMALCALSVKNHFAPAEAKAAK